MNQNNNIFYRNPQFSQEVNNEYNRINDDYNNKEKLNELYLMASSKVPREPQDPEIQKEYFKNKFIKNINNTSRIPKPIYRPIFRYKYDFDENGVFYYLGTGGRKHKYNNPNDLRIVNVFSSSILKGNLSDFVGRNIVNLSTENEENSFFGVDLGENRFLVPNAYSLRNRNSSHNVLLSWTLEGSNNKVNFELLDKRSFNNPKNMDLNRKLEKERNLLKQPGCTSTWGISRKIREKFPEGFRYFILKQVGHNSDGGYSMNISGFELYGQSEGYGWVF